MKAPSGPMRSGPNSPQPHLECLRVQPQIPQACADTLGRGGPFNSSFARAVMIMPGLMVLMRAPRFSPTDCLGQPMRDNQGRAIWSKSNKNRKLDQRLTAQWRVAPVEAPFPDHDGGAPGPLAVGDRGWKRPNLTPEDFLTKSRPAFADLTRYDPGLTRNSPVDSGSVPRWQVVGGRR